MNFAEFVAAKKIILDARPDIVDLSETRYGNALKDFRVDFDQVRDQMPVVSYRCHLAEFWLDHMGINRNRKPNTLITQGVRHSLKVLMDFNQGKKWAVPSDVYPVYWQISPDTEKLPYTSYPIAEIPDADFLLLCYPGRPRPEHMTMIEKANIFNWLKADSNRRIVVDAVYHDTLMNNFLNRLFGTDQIIFLTSLSKKFAEEKIMGICMVPDQDVALYTDTFRALRWENDKENFRKAEYLLTKEEHVSYSINTTISMAWDKMDSVITAKYGYLGALPYTRNAGNRVYFGMTEQNWESLLDQGVLAMPYSVYGGKTDCSVITPLSFVEPHRASQIFE